MRRRLSISVLVALLGWLALGLAGPAAAGGPTSVLLVDPASQKTASLYYDDPDYAELASLVGAEMGGPAQPSAGGPRSGSDIGSGITVTWLVHDVSVWRIDRINLDAIGGPVISTQTAADAADLWDSPVVDHRPADPGRLVALLERLGFGSGAGAAPDAAAVDEPAGAGRAAGAATDAGAAAGADVPAVADPRAASAQDTVLWALAGTALGAVLTLTLLRLAPVAHRWRRARGTGLPETAPADRHAGSVVEDDELGWGAPDELASAGGRSAR